MEKMLYTVTYSGAQVGESGEGLGSEYSLDKACVTCGAGARIKGNLFVKKLKGDKAFFKTLDEDFLVIDEVYHNLKLSRANIGELMPVIDHKSKKELSYYHFKTDFYLPKMLPSSEGIVTEDQCPICEQDGFFDEFHFGTPNPIVPRKYKYNYNDIKDLLKLSDIFNTWEHFGKSNLLPKGNKVVRYARPKLIVKENVKNIFDNFKIKKLSFEEVLFV